MWNDDECSFGPDAAVMAPEDQQDVTPSDWWNAEATTQQPAARETREVAVDILLRNAGFKRLCESQDGVEEKTTVLVPVEAMCNGAHDTNVSAATCEKLHFKGELPPYVTVRVAMSRIMGVDTARAARYDLERLGMLWPLCTDSHRSLHDVVWCDKGPHLREPTGPKAINNAVPLWVPADALVPNEATERLRNDATALPSLCNDPGCTRSSTCHCVHLKDDRHLPVHVQKEAPAEYCTVPDERDPADEVPERKPRCRPETPLGERPCKLLRSGTEPRDIDPEAWAACTVPLPAPGNVWPPLQEGIAKFFEAVAKQGHTFETPRQVIAEAGEGHVVHGMASAFEYGPTVEARAAWFIVPAVVPELCYDKNMLGVTPVACMPPEFVGGGPSDDFLLHSASYAARLFDAAVASVELVNVMEESGSVTVTVPLPPEVQRVIGGFGAICPRFATLCIRLKCWLGNYNSCVGGVRLERDFYVKIHLHPWKRGLSAA